MSHTFLQFLSEQWKPVPSSMRADLTGKTVLITGANSGLGYEAARHFCAMNPERLILACRSEIRGEASVGKLKAETGCTTVELMLVDLSDFGSVRAFCHNFVKRYNRLDILIQNAGVINNLEPKRTKDGWSTDLQVNNISSSLVSLLLLPTMSQTATLHGTVPRLVIVSSAIHSRATFAAEIIDSRHPLKSYNEPEYYNMIPPVHHYFASKLLNLFFARSLNEKLKSKSVIVNSVNPGYCATQLRRTTNPFAKVINWMGDCLLARAAEEGSRQLIWAAIGGDEEEEVLRGAYISLSKVCEPSAYVLSEEGTQAQNILWDDLLEELSVIEPKVVDIVKEYLK